MTSPTLRRLTMTLFAGLLALGPAGLADDENSVLTSVFARTDKGYKRRKAPDGSWVREYYAMTKGGPDAGTIQDNAQDKVELLRLPAGKP